MLMERAELLAKAGDEDKFEQALRTRSQPLLASIPGVQLVKVGRGVENPDKFILLVHWDSLDAHERFKLSPAYGELMATMGGFARGGGVEHFELDG
jgi:heme-degrading monooxygenase HmoA